MPDLSKFIYPAGKLFAGFFLFQLLSVFAVSVCFLFLPISSRLLYLYWALFLPIFSSLLYVASFLFLSIFFILLYVPTSFYPPIPA